MIQRVKCEAALIQYINENTQISGRNPTYNNISNKLSLNTLTGAASVHDINCLVAFYLGLT